VINIYWFNNRTPKIGWYMRNVLSRYTVKGGLCDKTGNCVEISAHLVLLLIKIQYGDGQMLSAQRDDSLSINLV